MTKAYGDDDEPDISEEDLQALEEYMLRAKFGSFCAPWLRKAWRASERWLDEEDARNRRWNEEEAARRRR